MSRAHRIVFALAALVAAPAFAQTFSGQVAFGQSTVEPAFDDADGSYVFLLTPDHAPLPSRSNPRAWAPMYIVVYPVGTTLAGELNCTPENCDHLQSLPFVPPPLASLYPGGQVAGHNHLVGVRPTGDFNVAWAVKLILFTPKAVVDGTIDKQLTTLEAVNAALASGDAVGPFDTPTVFNCSIVSKRVYTKAGER